MRTLKTANGPKEVILNVQPQAKDVRDEKYRLKIPRGSLRTVPSAVDNRNICSPIRDQGNLGSCTAFAVSGLVESAYNQTAQQWMPSWLRIFFKVGQNKISTLFQYYASRVIENSVNEDSGATIRGSVKAVANFGAVGESKWPYQISKFRTNPPGSVWAEAKQRKARSYHPIADGDLETMKALLSEGKLITFGFRVYDYMLSQDMAVHG
ncbi:MAG: hypothetical protein EB060_12150, partial [Proteobacteria bacterium]|nr:hypothetical protein [Pseudomonadota bacterium]